MSSLDLKTILVQAVDRYPERTALVISIQGVQRKFTYHEWNRRINRLAHALADMGVRQWDRVAFYVLTAEASVTCYFACQKIGAVAVPMNFRLTSTEAATILRDSGARVLIYSTRLAPQVESVEGEVPFLHDFIAVPAPDFPDLPPGHHNFEDLATNFPESHEPYHQPSGEDLSALVYTSGTTGLPKGVMHTHENDAAIAMNCVMEYGLRHTDTALHIAPLYHIGGMQAFFLPHLMVGGTNILLGKYNTEVTLNHIQSMDVTSLFAVPSQIVDLLHHPDFTDYDVSSLRFITTGGAAIPAPVMKRVLDELCPHLYNGYGMTEASLTLLLHPENALEKLGSCGKPSLISRAKIIDDQGKQVGRGEVGQLVVMGPQVMKGYWNKPRETREKIQNGWCFTGDLFSRDNDGFFWFHGRSDDMIVSGGENIYPVEVEKVLSRMEAVRECAVVGTAHEKWGQAVTAFIVKADVDLTEEGIDQFCRGEDDFNNFKRPRKYFFVDHLPRNPSGKVVKKKLFEMMEE